VRIDPQSRHVIVGDRAVPLNWRSFEALRIIVEASGEVVSRERLMEALWPAVHVEESSLNQCISQLRKAIEDGEGGVTIIETVPRRGYRLAATVSEEIPEPETTSATQPPAKPPRRFTAVFVMLLTSVAIAGLIVGNRWFERRQALKLAREGLIALRDSRPRGGGDTVGKLRKALHQFPELPLAYAGLAEAMVRSDDSLPHQPVAMAEKSVQLDPDCAECQGILGWILLTREWKWKQAEPHLYAAVQRLPRDARVRLRWAQYLSTRGRLDEAEREVEEAPRLAPAESAVHTMRAGILYLRKEWVGSIAAARQSLAMNPDDFAAWAWIYRSEMMRGNDRDAIWALVQSHGSYMALSEESKENLVEHLFAIHKRAGLEGVLRHWLDDTSSPPGISRLRYNRAAWRLGLKDRPGAIGELRNLFDYRPFQTIYLAVDPAFEPLHSDPAFQEILQKVGID
jgi:DNA-binding winged helix-turn-helix (wHTH) protein/tetratricopeptide (TPR) repeat protein